MSYKDLIWRLSLFKQRSDYSIYLMETAYGEMDSGSRIGQQLSILTICKKGIIAILMRYSTFGMAFIASVADIGGTSKPAAVLLIKVLAMLIAAWTGFALDVAELDFSTNICVVAIEPFGAEVMGIEKIRRF